MAETYHILDIRALPAKLLATLCAGLPDGCRVKRAMSDAPADMDTILLASIADSLRWLVWSQTKDGQKNRHRPKSILDRLFNAKNDSGKDVPMAFRSSEAFEAARARILRKE